MVKTVCDDPWVVIKTRRGLYTDHLLWTGSNSTFNWCDKSTKKNFCANVAQTSATCILWSITGVGGIWEKRLHSAKAKGAKHSMMRARRRQMAVGNISDWHDKLCVFENATCSASSTFSFTPGLKSWLDIEGHLYQRAPYWFCITECPLRGTPSIHLCQEKQGRSHPRHKADCWEWKIGDPGSQKLRERTTCTQRFQTSPPLTRTQHGADTTREVSEREIIKWGGLKLNLHSISSQ